LRKTSKRWWPTISRTAFHRTGWRPNRALFLAVAALAWSAARAEPPPPAEKPPLTIERVCDLIDGHAATAGIPRDFFARLIWKESRFDPDAVSPAGAEGIAQFMPGTARLRGLADSFDAEKALAASALYLADLSRRFGNLGLAAAAYNAGENRVTRWIASGGFLPMETENYVIDILGASPDAFIERTEPVTIPPLDPERQFAEACRALPVRRFDTIAMATVHMKPWGAQIAGHARRDIAIRQWLRIQPRFAMLKDVEPVVSRMRNGRAPRGIYAVRVGLDSRQEAEGFCRNLRNSGGSCVVFRNR
jgi:hypothetical protein